MSENEAHTGKLVPMIISGVTMEERCEAVCKKYNYEHQEWHESWEQTVRENCYRELYISGDIIYEIHNTELDQYGFAIAERDGVNINYTVLFYNGGGSLDEVLDEAVKKMK